VDAVAQNFVLFVAGLLVVIVAIRILIAVPGWIRRVRRPEARAIRVIGVGGGGSNAVDRMVAEGIPNVDFIACNTDAQALRRSTATTKIRIGDAITRGLGSGGDPEIGRRSAEDGASTIARAVAGADLLFVTAGLGGGTGSGAGPVVADQAKEHGALTIGVVTKPFAFEGTKRRRVAEEAARELTSRVDALITIPNDRVDDVAPEDASVLDAFRVVDRVVVEAVQGIIDLLSSPGLVNVDFADVRAVLQDAGPAVIGLGRGSGANRATDAARQAIMSPLLEASIEGADNVLLNITGPPDLQLREVRQAADAVRAAADRDANVIFGARLSEPAGEDVRVTLIATGLITQLSATIDREVAAKPAAAATSVAEPPSEAAGTEPSRAGGRRARSRSAAAPSDAAPVPAVGIASVPSQADAAPATSTGDELDVPTFLRRRPESDEDRPQADGHDT
jgi:cell division protein FtsZ